MVGRTPRKLILTVVMPHRFDEACLRHQAFQDLKVVVKERDIGMSDKSLINP